MKKLFVLLPGLHGTTMLQHQMRDQLSSDGDVLELTYEKSGSQNLQRFVDELEQRLRDDGRAATVIGHSTGALIGILLTCQHPHRVARLVLINSASGARMRRKILLLASRVIPYLPLLLFKILAVLSLPGSANLFKMQLKEILIFAKVSMNVVPSVISARIQSIVAQKITQEELQRLKTAVDIIASRFDFVIPSVKEAYFLAERLQNCKVHILPYSGHECLTEKDFNIKTIIGD